MNKDVNEKESESVIGHDKHLSEGVFSISDLSVFSGAFEEMRYKIKEDESSFIALVGPHGVGKSTFLHNFLDDAEKRKGKEIKRFKFDVWEVPGRKYLWDAFVLEFARTINPKLYKKVKGEIDGEEKNGIKKILKTVSILIPLCISRVSFNLKELFQKTKAKRVCEFQSIFKEVLKGVEEKTIFITLEDIDRSGEEGLYFIETLRKFLDNHGEELKKQFVILVPLLDVEYTKKDKKYRFEKVFDFIIHFDALKKNNQSIVENALKDIFVNDYDERLSKVNKYYREGIEKLAWAFQDISIREIKGHVREAESFCREYREKNKENLIFSLVACLMWLNKNKEKYIAVEEKNELGIAYKAANENVFLKFFIVAACTNVSKDKQRVLELYSQYFHKPQIRKPEQTINHEVFIHQNNAGKYEIFLGEPYLEILTRGLSKKNWEVF